MFNRFNLRHPHKALGCEVIVILTAYYILYMHTFSLLGGQVFTCLNPVWRALALECMM